MSKVSVLDKTFEPYIFSADIKKTVRRIAHDLSVYSDKNPIFISVLNGAFMFTSDLVKEIDFDCQITFIKHSSYNGTRSKGEVETLIGLQEDIKDREVILIEDIVDTGNTLESIIHDLKKQQPKNIKIATLFFKPEAFQKDYKIDYFGFEIPNDFIVGYGLDYNGYGRNLNDVYKIVT